MINYRELKLLVEIPLLFLLRLKKLFRRRRENGGGILVIDTCIIGDFVATLPALSLFIKNQGQDVDLVVTPPLQSLASTIRGVNKVFTARSAYQRVNEAGEHHETLPSHYARVMVLRISPDTYKMLKHVTYGQIDIYDGPYFKYFAHLIKNIFLKKPVKQWSEINFEMVGIERPKDPIRFEQIFDVSPSDDLPVRALPEMHGDQKKVLIHTGSGWNVKLWDNDKWTELFRKIHALGNYKIIVIGSGEVEARSFEYIQHQLDFTILSLVNRVDLKTTLLMMRISDYFVGIDSGPRNLAHLADLRSISLLGPAPKNFMPLDKRDIVIDKFTCRCKSFYYLHRASAIQRITADEVFDAFKRLTVPSTGDPSPNAYAPVPS